MAGDAASAPAPLFFVVVGDKLRLAASCVRQHATWHRCTRSSGAGWAGVVPICGLGNLPLRRRQHGHRCRSGGGYRRASLRRRPSSPLPSAWACRTRALKASRRHRYLAMNERLKLGFIAHLENSTFYDVVMDETSILSAQLQATFINSDTTLRILPKAQSARRPLQNRDIELLGKHFALLPYHPHRPFFSTVIYEHQNKLGYCVPTGGRRWLAMHVLTCVTVQRGGAALPPPRQAANADAGTFSPPRPINCLHSIRTTRPVIKQPAHLIGFIGRSSEVTSFLLSLSIHQFTHYQAPSSPRQQYPTVD